MAILDIIEIPDTRLKQVSVPVAAVTDATRALIADMFETMYDAPGIGLAAVQIGVPQRILVIDLQRPGVSDPDAADDAPPPPDVRDPKVFINPEILWESDEVTFYNEGCLSVPEQYADVPRPAQIKAKWLDIDGAEHIEDIDGLLATCLQHEIDHLNGVLFIDHLSKLKRDIIIKKLVKAQRKAA